MNLEVTAKLAAEPACAALAPRTAPVALGPRIERCEFEQLLQRAMEILNARHIEAQITAGRQ